MMSSARRKRFNVFAGGLWMAALVIATTVNSLASTNDYSSAVKLYQSGDFKQAVKGFNKIIMSDPGNTNAMYYAGLSYQKLGNKLNAARCYKALVRDHPDSAAGRYAARALKSLTAKPAGKSTKKSEKAATRGKSVEYIPESDSVPFRRHSNGHLYVNCRVNGRSLPMIFDTGAEICAIGKNDLRKLAIPLSELKPLGRIAGVGGYVKAWSMPATVELGRIKRVVNLSVLENLSTPLLGQTFFGDLRYNIDNATGSIKFKRQDARADYVPNDTIDIPYKPAGNNLVVQTRVNGVSIPMFFDTGASGTLFKTSALILSGSSGWRKVGYARSSGVAGSSIDTVYEVKSIELGPIKRSNIRVVVTSSLPTPYGLLGQDFFGRRKFTIDRDKQLIRFWR